MKQTNLIMSKIPTAAAAAVTRIAWIDQPRPPQQQVVVDIANRDPRSPYRRLRVRFPHLWTARSPVRLINVELFVCERHFPVPRNQCQNSAPKTWNVVFQLSPAMQTRGRNYTGANLKMCPASNQSLVAKWKQTKVKIQFLTVVPQSSLRN